MKTKLARYLSQLGRFDRKSISKQSGPTMTNSKQKSFSRSLSRGKMRVKYERVDVKQVYEGTQNKATVFKKGPTWCASNVTNNEQSKGFAPFVFRSRQHRTTSPPQASSNSLLFIVFASLYEHIKQYGSEGEDAASMWNTEQTASNDAVDGNIPRRPMCSKYVK